MNREYSWPTTLQIELGIGPIITQLHDLHTEALVIDGQVESIYVMKDQQTILELPLDDLSDEELDTLTREIEEDWE